MRGKGGRQAERGQKGRERDKQTDRESHIRNTKEVYKTICDLLQTHIRNCWMDELRKNNLKGRNNTTSVLKQEMTHR